jgi:hypothetical protein
LNEIIRDLEDIKKRKIKIEEEMVKVNETKTRYQNEIEDY